MISNCDAGGGWESTIITIGSFRGRQFIQMMMAFYDNECHYRVWRPLHELALLVGGMNKMALCIPANHKQQKMNGEIKKCFNRTIFSNWPPSSKIIYVILCRQPWSPHHVQFQMCIYKSNNSHGIILCGCHRTPYKWPKQLRI